VSEQHGVGRKLTTDPTYCICPRPTCQAAVPPPPLPTADDLVSSKSISSRAIRLSDISRSSPAKTVAPPSPPPTPPAAPSFPPDDRWARYRICPKCDFSFCLYCSATWHGPHTPCAFPQTSALVLEYLSYPENSPQRKLMEARRGRTNLERMVSKWREDEENRKWLESKTRPCSGCGVRVEKSHGCNHMTCGRCNAHFCYRCGDSVSRERRVALFGFRRSGWNRAGWTHADAEKRGSMGILANCRSRHRTLMRITDGQDMRASRNYSIWKRSSGSSGRRLRV